MNPFLPDLPRLGNDVSKLTFDACLLLPHGSKASAQFTNDSKGFAKLDVWLKEHHLTKVLAGLESTGPYGLNLLWHLHTQGHSCCMLNARRVKDYGRSQGRRVKTDRTDAALIASYLKTSEHLHLWEPTCQALRDLQALVRRRQDLMDALQAERNRLEANTSDILKSSLERNIKHLKNEVVSIGREIDALVLAHGPLQKSVRLLRSIDGIGQMVAVTILAEVPAISTFKRARDLAAFAGLTPCLAESGTSVRRRGHLSKEGSALLRKMLYMAALQAVKRTNNAFHAMYTEFVARGKAKMCTLVAIMHKLLRVAFGVLKHQTPFVANFAKL
jgi:transposase